MSTKAQFPYTPKEKSELKSNKKPIHHFENYIIQKTDLTPTLNLLGLIRSSFFNIMLLNNLR